MDDEHCLLAMRYVERNPIRAGMCRLARRYEWSSAAAHCGAADATGVLDMSSWRKLARGLDWEAELAVAIGKQEFERVRRSLHTGRPLASDGFLSKLEHKLGRRLRALPVGRPKKAAPAKARKKAKKRSGNR
jgi:putative transposase